MVAFCQRLEKRLSNNSRIKHGEISNANIATHESISALRNEIALKVSANETMCSKSLESAAKMPLR